MKRFMWILFALLLCLVGVELGLRAQWPHQPAWANRLAAPVPKVVGAPIQIKHPLVGIAPNPAFSQHDDRGWHNAHALEQAEVVVLGDSQVYGRLQPRATAFPQQLAHHLERSVYNMGWGGYCPVHLLAYWDQVKALRPAQVIVSVYLGNDFSDAFDILYHRGDIFGLLHGVDPLEDLVREQGLPSVSNRVAQIHLRDEKARRVAVEWRQWAAQQTEPGVPIADSLNQPVPPPIPGLLLPRLPALLAGPPAPEALPAYVTPHLSSMVMKGTFLARIRAPRVDLAQPEIAEGYRGVLMALQRWQELCDQIGADFAVLLLPTKERACADVLAERLAFHPIFSSLVEREGTCAARLKRQLDERNIAWLDALPGLRAQLANDAWLYHNGVDGHPNAAGNAAIAETLRAALVDGVWGESVAGEREVPLPEQMSFEVGATSVTARCIELSTIPNVEDIIPYVHGLVFHVWQAEGEEPLLVGHWAIREGHPLARTWQLGETRLLHLSPFDRATNLSGTQVVIDTEQVDLPMYIETNPLSP